jgi:photosystem I P700 chlorophyll a apoprotein A2
MSSLSYIKTEALILAMYRLKTSSPYYLHYFIVCVFDSNNIRLTYHIAALIGFTSSLFSGHIVHSSLMVYRGRAPSLIKSPTGATFDKDNHIWGSPYGAGSCNLSFTAHLKTDSSSLFPSDIAHHHISIGVLLILSSHLYRTLFLNIGSRITTLSLNIGSRITTLSLASALANELLMARNLSLGLNLFAVGTLLNSVSQGMASLPPYPYTQFVVSISIM